MRSTWNRHKTALVFYLFFFFFHRLGLLSLPIRQIGKKKGNQPQSHRTELSLFPISFLLYFCRAVGVTGHSSVGHTSPMGLGCLNFFSSFLCISSSFFGFFLAIVSPGKRLQKWTWRLLCPAKQNKNSKILMTSLTQRGKRWRFFFLFVHR